VLSQLADHQAQLCSRFPSRFWRLCVCWWYLVCAAMPTLRVTDVLWKILTRLWQ